MGIYVCNTANLQCSFGVAPATLMVLPSSCVMIANQPAATIMDFAPMTNVTTFGMCQSMANPTVALATAKNYGVLQPMPCIPVTVAPWVPPNPTVLIGNMPSLLDNGKCMCAWGGNISIVFPGQATVQTGASGAGSASSGSAGSAAKTNINTSDKDTKTQNKVLKKAAKEATPFCEECQKKEKKEKEEKEKKKKITRIFWIDEDGTQKTLRELPEGREITVCVATKNIDEEEQIDVEIKDENGRKYKGGKETMKFSAKVEADGCAYVEKVKLEYE